MSLRNPVAEAFLFNLQELRRSLEADQQAQAQALVQAQMLAQAQVEAQAKAKAQAQEQAKSVAESASSPPAQPPATQPETGLITANPASQIDADASISEATLTPPQVELGDSAYIDPTSTERFDDASASALDATTPTPTTEKDSALPI
jgi:hypothetical protein